MSNLESEITNELWRILKKYFEDNPRLNKPYSSQLPKVEYVAAYGAGSDNGAFDHLRWSRPGVVELDLDDGHSVHLIIDVRKPVRNCDNCGQGMATTAFAQCLTCRRGEAYRISSLNY